MKCQQWELYAAESAIAAKTREFEDAADMQKFVDDLRELPYWERNFENVLRVEMRVVPGRAESVGTWDAEHSAGVCEMLPVHCCELYALHEVTHVLAAARYGSRSHDPWFARTYVELVSIVLGPERYLELAAAFDEHGVDFDTSNSASSGIAL